MIMGSANLKQVTYPTSNLYVMNIMRSYRQVSEIKYFLTMGQHIIEIVKSSIFLGLKFTSDNMLVPR